MADDSGKRFIQIHGSWLAIDNQGNLLLDTVGRVPGQQVNGGTPHFGGHSIPSEVGISNGIGASSNICNVTFQVQDLSGNAVAGVFNLDILLSDAATGVGLTATTPSGGIAAVATDGTVIGVLTSSKAVRVQTNAAGVFVLAITDTAKTGFYPVANSNVSGATFVGAQLTTASYHT
jgi:hypothetical protein